MFAFDCKACSPQDPATSTVKVELDAFGTLKKVENLATQRQTKENAIRREDLKRLEQERLAKEEARRAEEQAEEQRQKEVQEASELEARRAREAERRKAMEIEALHAKEQEEQRAREEEELRERQRMAAAEQERLRKDREHQEQQRIEQEERSRQVAAFLQKNGFSSVGAKKNSLMSSTYALHKAAEAGDKRMVVMLIKEGANPNQKNSAGKTAAQAARKKDKAGSHAEVLAALGETTTTKGVVGGA